jgi:hypothetical protein
MPIKGASRVTYATLEVLERIMPNRDFVVRWIYPAVGPGGCCRYVRGEHPVTLRKTLEK